MQWQRRDENEKIAVYGIGKLARNFIVSNPMLNICACLDKNLDSGEYNGVPICSWDEVFKLGINTIVIAASVKNLSLIYNRIYERCFIHGISIFNISGVNLSGYYGVPKNLKNTIFLKQSLLENKKMINEYNVISFDVFDTIVMRKVLNPCDIFDIVEFEINKKEIVKYGFDFKTNRVLSEQKSEGKSIYVIYEILRELTGIDEETSRKILDVEIACEKANIIARHDMVQLLKYAKGLGKKVYLVSDMYLPKDIMAEILSGVDIVDYDQLIVSCDMGMAKRTGLFKWLREKEKGKSILHIGDKQEIDIEPAIKEGISAHRICSAKDMLKVSNVSSLMAYADNINERNLLGLLISDLFNSPFALNDSNGEVEINKLEQFGAMCLAPLMIIYQTKLKQMLDMNKYSGVLFVARDMYLFKKVYDLLMWNKTPSKYLFSSRKLSIRSGIHSQEDLEISFQYFKQGKYSNLLSELYGIDDSPSQEKVLSWDNDENVIRDIVYENSMQIFEHSRKTQEGYIKWMSTQEINISSKYLLSELNGFGTSHYYLDKIFDKPLDALYLVRNHKSGGFELQDEALWRFYNGTQMVSSLINNNPLMEIVFTSPDASVIDMKEDGTPIFAIEKRTEEHLKMITNIQAGIVDFSVKYLKEMYIDDIAIKKELPEQLLKSCSEIELSGDCELLKNTYFFNDIGNIKQNLFTGAIL